MPSTIRTTSVASPRGGMQSTTRTMPSAVSQNVSSTSVSPRYCRRLQVPPAAGASSQWPFAPSPSSAAKQAGESNRGRHSQSIEPSRPTSAAVCRSPSSA